MRTSGNGIGIWRRCQRKAFYTYVMDIDRVVQSIAPSKGSLVHKCLEYHYSGKDWTQPIKDIKIDMDAVFDEEREMWANLPDDVYRVVNGYLNTYREADEKEKVLATEKHFVLPLSGGHEYEGIIDKIVLHEDSGVWTVDYKTAADIPDVTELFMDVTTAMYALAVARGFVKVDVTKGTKVGIVFDHIRTKAPRIPTVLKNGTISKAACVTDVATYMTAVRNNGLDPKDYEDMIPQLSKHVFYRRAAIPLRKSSIQMIETEVINTVNAMDNAFSMVPRERFKDDYAELAPYGVSFPRTFIRGRCNWDCPYYKLCVGELSGRDIIGIIEADYKKREGRTHDADEIE